VAAAQNKGPAKGPAVSPAAPKLRVAPTAVHVVPVAMQQAVSPVATAASAASAVPVIRQMSCGVRRERSWSPGPGPGRSSVALRMQSSAAASPQPPPAERVAVVRQMSCSVPQHTERQRSYSPRPQRAEVLVATKHPAVSPAPPTPPLASPRLKASTSREKLAWPEDNQGEAGTPLRSGGSFCLASPSPTVTKAPAVTSSTIQSNVKIPQTHGGSCHLPVHVMPMSSPPSSWRALPTSRQGGSCHVPSSAAASNASAAALIMSPKINWRALPTTSVGSVCLSTGQPCSSGIGGACTENSSAPPQAIPRGATSPRVIGRSSSPIASARNAFSSGAVKTAAAISASLCVAAEDARRNRTPPGPSPRQAPRDCSIREVSQENYYEASQDFDELTTAGTVPLSTPQKCMPAKAPPALRSPLTASPQNAQVSPTNSVADLNASSRTLPPAVASPGRRLSTPRSGRCSDAAPADFTPKALLVSRISALEDQVSLLTQMLQEERSKSHAPVGVPGG